MPARKPSPLIVKHETAVERTERAARESSVRPARGLPISPPAQLKDREAARTAWRYLMRRFSEIEGEIVTGLDLHLVINFCMAIEQLAQLNVMRDKAYFAWLILAGEHDRLGYLMPVEQGAVGRVKVVQPPLVVMVRKPGMAG